MGLRTASVRHPHVEVMAPALTETNQTQSFKLPANQSASPINGKPPLKNGKDLNNAFDNLNTLALATELLKSDVPLGNLNRASDNFIMSDCPLPMGDHDAKMGLQKAGLDDVSALLKERHDTDEIFFPDMEAAGDIGDIMEVFKSMEGSDRSVPGDLSAESDSIFPLSTSDLTSTLGKDLFNDVMNMNIDEPLIDNTSKETQTKDLLHDVNRRQAKLERKMDFLLRRIRKFQVRNMGQHISGEVAGVFEHVHRTLRRCKDASLPLNPVKIEENSAQPSLPPLPEHIKPIVPEKLKPISYNSTKNLVKKLEMSTVMQANNSSRQRHSARYFGSGSMEPNSFRATASGLTILPQWATEEKHELQRVAGNLESELCLVQDEMDSEATVSSSGGESCDELQSYTNPHQQYLPIHKRAAWKYAVDRAAIASRWTWLQSQISDLEYRIRQHSDLHRKQRASKDSVQLGGSSPQHTNSIPSSPSCVNGYRGQLPGASPTKSIETQPNGTLATQTADVQCARTRPLVNFRKRKLLQFTGLHAVSKKAARPSTIRCGCVPPDITCALCTGRTDPTHPRDLSDYLSKNEKLGLLDPSYHPVFSLNEDASAILHMEAIMKTTEWQQRSSRSNLKSMKFVKGCERLEKPSGSSSLDNRPRKLEHRKKYNRLIKASTANALSASRKGIRSASIGRIKKRTRVLSSMASLGSDGADDEVEALAIGSSGKFDSPNTSPLLSAQAISGFQRRNRVDSYDIDNIIIPYSVAASTRVEKLQYKEILTPKWRIAESEFSAKYDFKNNGVVKTSQVNKEVEEDLTEEAVVVRHEKCEQDEKKKFLSYLKLPIGYGRSRANRRTDSRAESSGANTPDPMSPAPALPPLEVAESIISPLTTPPATPSNQPDETNLIGPLRRRTLSQSRLTIQKEAVKDDVRCNTPDQLEVLPYEKRVFPLHEDTYDKMLRNMPEEHKLKTNILSQDSSTLPSPASEFDEKFDMHDSESTESAFGDEDPNDPEWDVEHVKDRYRR